MVRAAVLDIGQIEPIDVVAEDPVKVVPLLEPDEVDAGSGAVGVFHRGGGREADVDGRGGK